MKVGDLVKLKNMHRRQKERAGLITDFVDKKCWRSDKMGTSVDWGLLEPEPHAVVLVGERYLTIPVIDLEVINNESE
jgi:hypothetical protein